MKNDGVMFNAYPDSCGGKLSAAASLLSRPEFKGVFRYFYLLPSIFQSDLDRGFSVISYELDESLATIGDLECLRRLGMQLKLDFVVNHLSVQSPEFQNLLEKGEESPYAGLFIDWNDFWEGEGTVGPEGYVIPLQKHLSKLFMRKPELPILRVPFPDGSPRFYWNTFYQRIDSDQPAGIHGQVDLDAKSEKTWRFYADTVEKLASYGARILRLDAFAYLHKEVGEKNFFNKPGTWDYLQKIHDIAADYELELLPEIHASYTDGIHKELAERGYRFYDFFFPALVIDAIENGDSSCLISWIEEIRDCQYRTVNMLGCHDGIPVLDVCGLLDDERINRLTDVITSRGGYIKDLYGPDGKKISYYQVNAAFFSALGEDPRKMLLARAVQIFMPGIPEVWYLDVFAGVNDEEAASKRGHKEINRTNLTMDEIEHRLTLPLVQQQLQLLRFRNSFPVFNQDAVLTIRQIISSQFELTWEYAGKRASLNGDFLACSFSILYDDGGGERTLMFSP